MFIDIPVGTELHRVHLEKYDGDQFNPSPNANARFSSILDSTGDVIPTMYCASTFSGALMETVFHDVPYQEYFKLVYKSELVDRVHTTLTTNQPIKVVELSTKALRKLGVKPEHLVTSEKSNYEYSRSVAKEIFDKNPDIQGLKWVSRQDNTSIAFMLFGNRFAATPFNILGRGISLIDEEFKQVIEVAEEIGAYIVPDSMS
jgi:hypothetical protein